MFLFLRSSTYPVRDHLPRCVFPKSTERERERERKIEREREKCGGCAPMSAALVSISVRLPRGGREGGAARCVWLKERDRARGWERERERERIQRWMFYGYHAAKNIPLQAQSVILTSIKVNARRARWYLFHFPVFSARFHYSYL